MADAAAKLEALMGKTVRVTLPDTRKVVGQLSACDKSGNIILSNCGTEGDSKQPPMQVATISRENIVKFEVQE